MTLHIVQSSPFSNAALTQCLSLAASDDAVLLIADATYALLQPQNEWPTQATLLYLEEDAVCRGITPNNSETFKGIHYAEFVELTVVHSNTINWG